MEQWGERLPGVWIESNEGVKITPGDFKNATTSARPTEQPPVTMDSLWEASKELSKIAYEMSRNDSELGQHLGCYVKSDLSAINIYPHLNAFGLPKANKPI